MIFLETYRDDAPWMGGIMIVAGNNEEKDEGILHYVMPLSYIEDIAIRQ